VTAAQARVTALCGITLASPDPEGCAHLLTAGFGWERWIEGRIAPQLERQWGLARGAAGPRAVILRSPGSSRGMLRLVQGTTRRRSRRFAARWAGVEMIVSRDLDALWEQVREFPGFDPRQPPLTMDWSSFGSNMHRAFIGIGPGGTHLALTMGLTQPVGREFPRAAAQVGHVFELPLITSEFERSLGFYGEVLGMTPILSSSFDRGPWHALWQLREPTPVRLDILKGDVPGTGLGGIELTGYSADLIDPEPAIADQFDGGTCLVSYTTPDIEAAFRAVARDPRARVLSEPHLVEDAPYCGTRCFAFLGPDGERVELLATDWSAS